MEHATMAAFSAFHAAHPRVYQLLRRFALEARRAGARRLSINMLFERVRWESSFGPLEPASGDFKVNNNHRAYYARLLMEQEPDLAGLFSTRRARADREVAP